MKFLVELKFLAERRAIEEALVAKREHFVTSVRCPECARDGSATWEENESGNLETAIKRIGPDNEIVCAECGVKARIIGIAVGTKQEHSSTSG
jgi:Zn ribbon nucleic-acid-binding protein